MEAQQNEKKKKKKGLLIIFIILALLGTAVGLVFANVKKQPGGETSSADESETVEEPTSWQYFWNVDRLDYAGKSDIGMSAREPAKEDGYYHVLFAVDGRQVTRRVAEKKLINLIDMNDLMGLLFDEKGIVIAMKSMDEITDGYEIPGYYVESVSEDGTIQFRTSSSMKGQTVSWKAPEGMRIWDVSGSERYVGQEVKLKELIERDRLFVIRNLDGTITDAFLTAHYSRPDIYWNVERKYNSELKATTRDPNALGEYEILMAVNGEQVVVKTKSRNVATAIDSMAAKCMALEFDPNGYAVRTKSASGSLMGTVFGSWAHITSLENNHVIAEKLVAASDQGKISEGDLASDYRAFDVSGIGEFVGVEITDLREGDQIHGLTNSKGEVQFIFVVGRQSDTPVYWNCERKYDSKTKETTRKPNANGLYEFKLAADGVQYTYYADKKTADLIDGSYAARCFGLKVNGNVIEKVIAANSCRGTGGGVASSWYTIMSMSDSTHFHSKKLGTASDAGQEYDGVITKDTLIVNGSTNYNDHCGEKTTLQVGDQIHVLLNLRKEPAVVFVVSRPLSGSLFWNAKRMYNSITKETTRTPDENGYYVFEFLVDGGTKTLRTKDKSLATTIDAAGVRLSSFKTSGDIITRYISSTGLSDTSGGPFASWAEVTKINSATSFHTLKDPKSSDSHAGEQLDVITDSGTKIFNVSGTYEDHPGERTTVKVGDTVHCLKNKDGNVSYVFVVSRKAPDKEAYCPYCEKTVTWTNFTGVVPKNDDGTPTHQYMYGNREFTNWAGLPANAEVHLDMNGKTLTGPDDIRCLLLSTSGNSTVRIFDLSGKGGIITGGTGQKNNGSLTNGALISLGASTNKLYLKDVTIDASTISQANVNGAVFVPKGATLTVEDSTILGGKLESGAAIYALGNVVLKNATVTGGTSVSGGSVTVAGDGTLSVNGKTVVTGGKRTDGTEANIFLENGKKLTTADGLTDGSKLGVRLSESGIFAGSEVGTDYAASFVSDIPESPVSKRTDNQLEIKYTVTGIAFTENEVTLQVGMPTKVTATLVPANDPDTEIVYESSDPSVSVLPDGTLVASKALTTPVTVTAKTKDGRFSAAVSVKAEGSLLGAHYHEVGTNAGIHDGTGTKLVFTPWNSKTALPKTSGYYFLTEDIHFTERQPMIPEGVDITVCLNGHKVINDFENNVQALALFYPGSTFTLLDCSDGEKGTFESTGSYNQLGRTVWVRYGTFNFYGGTIVGSDCTATTGGGAVNVSAGAVMNMYGGTVKNGTAIQGGNIYVGGNLNVYGGTIKDGTASKKGGNIYISTTGIATVENTEISGGTAQAGGNVSCWGKGISLTDCTLTNGTASDAGGNLQILSGEVLVKNTVLSGGKASAEKAEVHVNGQANAPTMHFTLEDATVQGGVLVQGAEKMTVKGSTKIGTDTGKVGITLSNTSFKPNLYAESLSSEAKIYINANAVGKTVIGGAPYADAFVLTKSGYTLVPQDNDLYIATDHSHCLCGGKDKGVGDHASCTSVSWMSVGSEAEISALLGVGEALTSGTAEYSIYLSKDITLTKPISIYTGVTLNICLNGHTLTGAKDQRVFMTYYAKPGKITLCDCSSAGTGTVQCTGAIGTSSNTLQGHALLLYNAGCEFVLYGGTIQGGHTNNNFGGNIAVSSGTTFTMYGGAVKDGNSEKLSTGSSRGGNIGISGTGAKAFLYGGTVSGGKARYGGNIYVDGELVIDGATVAGGVATAVGSEGGFGGNIAVAGKVTLKSGEILNGSAVGKVGGNIGIYNANGQFTMEGGKVSGGQSATNTAAGGISAFYQATNANAIVLKGGTVTGNKGGIYAATGTFTVSGDATVDENNNANITVADLTKLVLGGDLTGGKLSFALPPTAELLPSDKDFSAYIKNDNDTYKAKYDGAKKVHTFTMSVVPHDADITHCICGGTHNSEGGHVCASATWKSWGGTPAEQTALPTEAGNYYLVSDVALGSADITLSKAVTICLNGHAVTGDKAVKVTGSLTVCDCQAATVNGVYYAGKTVLNVTEPTDDILFKEEASGTVTLYDGIHTNSDMEKSVDLLNDVDPDRVIDIYILAGQSNAEGSTMISSALDSERDYNVYENVHYYSVRKRADGTAGGENDSSFGPVKEGLGFDATHVGPELGMASVLNEQYKTSDKQAVILKYAAGGTSILYTQGDTADSTIPTLSETNKGYFFERGSWRPEVLQNATVRGYGENRPTGFLTRGLIRSVSDVYKTLTDAGYKKENIHIISLSWMQGETDRLNPTDYKEAFPLLVSEIRTGISTVTGQDYSKLPFVVGEISESFSNATVSNVEKNRAFVAMQNQLPYYVENVTVIPTSKLQLTELQGTESVTVGSDTSHWKYADILTVGRLFAGADLTANEAHSHCVCAGTVKDHACEDALYIPWANSSMLPRYDDLSVGENRFFLTTDLTLTSNWQIGYSVKLGACVEDMGGRNVTICLNGHKIQSNTGILLNSLRATSPSVTFVNGINVTLTDCSAAPGGVKLRKDYAAGSTRGQFARLAGQNNVLTIYAGIYDANGANATTSGALLSLENAATLNLYGGTLRGGQSTQMGGQIYMTGTSVLNLYGGTIENGISSTNGGNIYMTGSSVVNMYGGTIQNGKTLGSTAGNLYMIDKSVFNMNGGTIAGGESSTYGANMRISGTAVFNMNDGTIRDGKITGTGTWRVGANVYVLSGDKTVTGFKQKGGTISGGTGAMNGGSVEVETGIYEMTGGTITGGKAVNQGGNIYINQNGTFLLKDGTVSSGVVNSNKTAATAGGNIFTKGTFTMTGGLVTGGQANENVTGAQGSGGNIYVYGGTATVSGGTVKGGNGTFGGNFYAINAASKLNVTGGTVEGGYAWAGGAFYLSTSATLSIGGTVTVKDNQCGSGYAPGIYVNTGVLTLDGTPTFTNNNQKTSTVTADLFVKSGSGTVTVSDTFNPATPLKVTRGSGSETMTEGTFADAAKDLSAKFKASNASYTITYSGGKLSVKKLN